MPRFLLDTSCMVPVLCSWHEHNRRATREIDRRLDTGETMVIAAPALIETYSVLTRLPSRYRLSPADARTLLQTSFLDEMVETIALDATAYWHLLQSAPDRSVVGGTIYDAVIVACAVAAGVDAILTFNERHFRSVVGSTPRIVLPGLTERE